MDVSNFSMLPRDTLNYRLIAFQIFGRCVELFSHLIEDFQLKYELPKNTAFTEYFAALVENMRLKLE